MIEPGAGPNQLLTQANGLFEAGKLAEAARIYAHLLARFPPKPFVLRRLAAIAIRQGVFQDAENLLTRALELLPDDVPALVERSVARSRLGRHDSALADLDRVIALQPENADAFRNRGIALMKLARWEESVASFRRAIELAPRNVHAHMEFGVVLADFGRLDDAMAHFDAALAINHEAPRARAFKAELLLLLGDYEQGWELYESRFRTDARVLDPAIESQRRWTGVEPIAGRSVLMYPEVGFGDFIMFARYVPRLQALGAKVVMRCPDPLVGLMRSSFPDAIVEPKSGPVPQCDFRCPIMGLPHAFRTTVETIPSDFPYLHVRAEKAAQWAARLGPRSGPRIGLVWAGEPNRLIDSGPARRRSMELADIEPLFGENVQIHVLHKRVSDDERARLAAHANVHLHDHELADFEETGALVEQLDLVVTIDTSVAHLAGALAKPVWVMLPPACDYRWAAKGDKTPWYETATLFRRTIEGGWAPVVAAVRERLRTLASA